MYHPFTGCLRTHTRYRRRQRSCPLVKTPASAAAAAAVRWVKHHLHTWCWFHAETGRWYSRRAADRRARHLETISRTDAMHKCRPETSAFNPTAVTHAHPPRGLLRVARWQRGIGAAALRCCLMRSVSRAIYGQCSTTSSHRLYGQYLWHCPSDCLLAASAIRRHVQFKWWYDEVCEHGTCKPTTTDERERSNSNSCVCVCVQNAQL